MADYPALEITFRASSDPFLRDRLYAQLDDFAPVAIHEDEAGATGGACSSAPRPAATRRARRSPPTRRVDDLADRRARRRLGAPLAGQPEGDRRRRPDHRAAVGRADGQSRSSSSSRPRGSAPAITRRPGCACCSCSSSSCAARACWTSAPAPACSRSPPGSSAPATSSPSTTIPTRSTTPATTSRATAPRRRSTSSSDDLGGLRIQRADIVLANLTGAVLVRYAAELRSLALDGGYFILSGFAPRRRRRDPDGVRRAHRHRGADRRRLGGALLKR